MGMLVCSNAGYPLGFWSSQMSKTNPFFCSRCSSTIPMALAGVKMPPFRYPAFSHSSPWQAAGSQACCRAGTELFQAQHRPTPASQSANEGVAYAAIQ